LCDRTAWRLKHKLLQAMAERESSRVLAGTVAADDAVVGGKRGRGAEGKAVFIARWSWTRTAIPSTCASIPCPI
jgi:hypothetical protein